MWLILAAIIRHAQRCYTLTCMHRMPCCNYTDENTLTTPPPNAPYLPLSYPTSTASNLPGWCAQGKGVSLCPCIRESLSWIRMTRTARQDGRRSGKEHAGHSLFLEECLFGFYGEHNSTIRKGSCRDVMWRDLVVTWRLIRDWSYLLTFRVSLEKLARAEHSK